MNTQITLQNLDQILKSSKAVVLKFSSPGCGPCKKLAQNLDEALNSFSQQEIKVYEINIAESIDLAQKFMIFSVPVLIFFLNGKEIKRFNGLVKSEELKTILNQLFG